MYAGKGSRRGRCCGIVWYAGNRATTAQFQIRFSIFRTPYGLLLRLGLNLLNLLLLLLLRCIVSFRRGVKTGIVSIRPSKPIAYTHVLWTTCSGTVLLWKWFGVIIRPGTVSLGCCKVTTDALSLMIR